MVNFNLRKIRLSYMLGLRNQEFPEVFSSICSTLEREEITEPYLAECLQLAKTKEAGLKFLKNMSRKHPLTVTISELTKDRYDYLLSLRGKTVYGMKSPIKEEREAAKVLNLWMERYHKHLKNARTHEQNLLSDQLVDDIINEDALGEAMDQADLSTHFNAITNITADIRKALNSRSKDAEAQSREAELVRRDMYEVLKRVINALDMTIILNGENSERYAGYWNEIAKMLDKFNAKVLSRTTRRRNAEEEDELENPIEGNGDENDEQAMENGVNGVASDMPEGNTQTTTSAPRSTVAMRSRPYNVLRLNERMDEDLQIVDKAYEDWMATKDAMSESETNEKDDVATTTDDEAKAAQDDDAGDGGFTDNTEETSPREDDTSKHDDAKQSD